MVCRTTLLLAALLASMPCTLRAEGPATNPQAAAPPAEKQAVWWSLKPLVKPDLPQVPEPWSARVRTPIDRFVFARLSAAGLAPSADTDRRTLLRRVTIDLTGLPPTFEENQAFLADASPDAYDKVVDRLLASPRFGERWARHWMDLAHFAETHGHDQDRPRPNAWPYRDYLIRAFNEDRPYGRFVEEQIAGDVLYPEDPQGVVALGFLASGPWDESSLMSIMENTVDKKIARNLDRDDMLATAMSTFVSSTVHCARCHDHKFDPIPQVDYYRVQAAFAGVDKAERTYDADPQIAKQRRELLAEKQRLQALAETADPTLLAADIQSRVAAWEAKLAENAKIWTVVEPETFMSTGGSTLTKQSDGSLLAGGERPEKDTYTITANINLPSVTGVKLEVLPDASLPQQGPGRQDNGNLHLSEFRLLTNKPGTAEDKPEPVKLKAPLADFDQDGWGIAKALDGDPVTAWGIHPQVGRAHQATFELETPLASPSAEGAPAAEPAKLTFVLEQLHGRSHLIGRPRLSVTSVPAPWPATPESLPAALAELVRIPAAERTDMQRASLAALVLIQDVEQSIAKLPEPQKVYAAAYDFKGEGNFQPAKAPREIHVLYRGEVTKPGDVALPGALRCIEGLPAEFELAHPEIEGERRAALARWISDRRNVLTWRSIVNRLWHHHFGKGIVDTPNDLGRMGGVPSHPELLDWLAVTLQEQNGSLKELHRLIVTSTAYRQASVHEATAAEKDADNRLLWRMNRTRLDAETVRDSMLQITGRIDLTMGGPSVKQFIQKPGIQVTPDVDYLNFEVDRPENARRSVYRFVFRTLPDPFMESLDCADSSQLTPVRNVSISPLQALTMLNNQFVVRHAEHLAARAVAKSPEPAGQIVAVYEMLLNRTPTEKEQMAVAAYATRHGLANTCRVLLNSNEFLFVD